MKKVLTYIMNQLDLAKVRYEIHNFDSGAIMIDIWINERFYVVQMFGGEIGLSLVTENTGFDNIPDKSFIDPNEFYKEFEKVFT